MHRQRTLQRRHEPVRHRTSIVITHCARILSQLSLVRNPGGVLFKHHVVPSNLQSQRHRPVGMVPNLGSAEAAQKTQRLCVATAACVRHGCACGDSCACVGQGHSPRMHAWSLDVKHTDERRLNRPRPYPAAVATRMKAHQSMLQTRNPEPANSLIEITLRRVGRNATHTIV